jgi:protein gp37
MANQSTIPLTERIWNPWQGTQRVVRTKTLLDPLRWHKQALAKVTTELVFTCSRSDWFIKEADPWRAAEWEVVSACPNLIFQILTKCPERIRGHLPPDWGEGYPNVWLGVSIERNDHVQRADLLRQVPAAVRFISAEPLLGPLPDLNLNGIHWLIVGGGHLDPAWARMLRERCKAAGVPFFLKPSGGLDAEVIHEYPDMAAMRA